jgi:hypothetical protein
MNFLTKYFINMQLYVISLKKFRPAPEKKLLLQGKQFRNDTG